MRRSAAPSFRADIKRARFLPQILKTIPSVDKENTSESPREINNLPNVSLSVVDSINEIKRSPQNMRSDEDVLNIIFEADSTVLETKKSSDEFSSPIEKSVFHPPERNSQKTLNMTSLKTDTSLISLHSNSNENFNDKLSNCIFCVKDVEEAALFSVVWCKRSAKKHKTWEGDGLLIVKSRSAVLKDLNGKTLDKGVGYKLKETELLEEGSKFFIGGKECEIQCRISDDECASGKYCKCISTDDKTAQSPVKQSEAVIPVSTHKPS